MQISHIYMSILGEAETDVSVVNEVISEAASEGNASARLNVLFGYFGDKIRELGSNLLAGIIVAVIGWYVIKLICKACKKLLYRSRLDDSVSDFLLAIIKIILRIVLFITIATTLGIQMTSFLTLLASAGLAISLSLQGCLTNFAGGVLILILKPFTVGDYIVDSSGHEGTVTSIDIIYTRLLTLDNRSVVIPNGNLANSTVTNVTKESIRRIDFNISINYSENIEKVRGILESTAKNHPLVLQDHEISAFVNKFDPSAIDMTLRVWVKTEDYWTLKAQLQELIKVTFDQCGIIIPYDKLDVNIVTDEEDKKK